MAKFRSDGMPQGGRRAGARNKLQTSFIEDLLEAWQRDGKAALKVMMKEEPSRFVQVVASLMPKEVQLEATGPLAELTDDELNALLQHVRQERAALGIQWLGVFS
jgi:hypothetical protein